MKIAVLSSLLLMLGLATRAPAIERPEDLDQNAPNERPAQAEARAEAEPGQPGEKPAPEAADAWLGVLSEAASETLSLHLGFESGVVLSYVAKGSPAAKAGLEQHDIVTAVDGRAVGDQDTLRDEILAHKPGDEVTLSVVSRGKKGERKVLLEERPADLPRLPVPGRHMHFQFPNQPGPGGKMPEGFKGLEVVPPGFGKDARERLDKHMKELEKQLKGMERGGMLELNLDLQDMLKNKKGLNFDFKSSSSFKFFDDQGSVEMQMKDGGKEARVRDKDGKLLFEGPWDTPQDKAAAPPEIRERIEQMNDGTRFEFHLENMPEPELELPEEEEDEME